MAGAMVPRNAGDERLIRQQRRMNLAEHTRAIRELIPAYRQHRDMIRDHLWQVYEQHLYMETHRSFEQWFLQSGLAVQLSYSTARRMISEKRPVGEKKKKQSSSEQSFYKKGSKSVNDFFKNPLPDNCKPVYMNKTVQKLIDDFGEAIARWETPECQFALEKEKHLLPWYDAAKFQERIQIVTHDLIVILADLQANRPMGLCPKCGGQRCETCRSCGMLPRAVYERLKDEEHANE